MDMLKKDKKEKLSKNKSLFKTIKNHDNSTMFLMLLIIIALVVIVEFVFARDMVFSKVAFLTGSNISSVLQQIAITGIVAIGMTLVMLMGGIDLSVGQMMGFIGVSVAYLVKAGNLPVGFIIIIGLVIGIVCQVIMGLIISRTELEPFIVSLGFMSVYQGFTYLVTKGREITFSNFSYIGTKYISIGGTFRLFLSVLVFLLLVVIVWLAIKYTKFGRRLYAVGGNPDAAYLAGVNVKNFKLLVYALNGVFVSIAAMILVSRLGTGGPNIGTGKEIDVIAAVVVGGTALSGGKGNIWGTVIGVILLGCISNALNILGVNPYWQYIMKGFLIIVSVLSGYYSGRKRKS